MANYSWYSTSNSSHMVNGIDQDSSVDDNGLIAVAKQGGRTAPVRVIYDTEGSNVGAMLQDITAAPLIQAQGYDASRFSDVHNKIIYVATKGVMTGSGNFSGAQTNNSGGQPNNYLWVFSGGAPTAVQAYADYLESFSSGLAMRATQGSYIHHPTAFPSSDTIEVYFSNDDNDSIAKPVGDFNPTWTPAFSANGDYDIEDILSWRAQKAQESIFYAINRFTLTAVNGHNGPNGSLREDIVSNAVAFKAGVEQSGNDGGSGNYAALSGDHTCRDASAVGSRWRLGQMHNKFMIFDLEIVATGSANHTGGSMRDDGTWTGMNAENEIIIHDFRLARRYVQYLHYLMDNTVANAAGGGDHYLGFKNNKPGAPTNLTVTPSASNFALTWTAPATNMDSFSRYYVFISPNAINSNKDIGDEFDDDGDSMVDEDPVGNVDGFSTASANDDDADGTSDEDPWRYPEAQVRGGGTSATISTVNVGDALAPATNYWFAVVAVDSMGFESILDTSGPHQLGSDTNKVQVTLNSNLADTNARRNETNVIASRFFIRGDTTIADTLAIFAVKNLGNTDSADITVKLWRDEDADSAITTKDTLVATLAWNAASSSYKATLANDSRAKLGTTGKNFIVTLDISATAGYGETFQLRVDVSTCSSSRRDSGPGSQVTNSGIITIVSANQITVEKRGDTPSGSLPKSETRIVMTLRIGVSTANDTLTSFAVTNLGTMQNADVAGITLYEDAGADSILTAADTKIATIPFAAGTTWRNSSISYPFTGTSFNALVTVSAAGAATSERTFWGQIDIREVRMSIADSGPLAAVTTTAVFTIPSDFGPDTQIVINEVQPNPGAGSDIDADGVMGDVERDEEYVEVFNRGTQNVNLAGWTCVTKSGGENIVITNADSVILQPGWFGVFKSETGSQMASASFRIYNETGIFVETHAYSTNNWTTYAGVFNTSDDTAFLRNSSGTIIDSYTYVTSTNGDFPFYRYLDGWTSFKGPGLSSPSYGRPNGRFTIIATPTSSGDGISFNLGMTALDNEGSTCTSFTGTVSFTTDRGSIAPTTSGAFVSGIKAESVSISGLFVTESVTIKVSYNTADTGVTTVTIIVTPPDTKTVVTLNSNVADSSIPRGTDTVVLLRLRIRGDTTGGGDTLSYFSVQNLGNADTGDMRLTLWRDDGDSQWNAADSFVAQLSLAGGLWSVSGLQTSAAAYLGSGGTAGRNFLLLAELYDTAGLTETIQLRIPSLGVKAVTFDSGPAAALTNSGKITIISANQVTVAVRGDTPSETMGKGETRVVMTLLVGATNPNDTITAFAVTNVGSMQNADIAALRLYHDAGADSLLTAADTLIATLPFATGSTWRNTGVSYPYTGASIPVLVTIQTAVGATGGLTFQGRVAAYEVGISNADSGPTAAITYTAVYSIASDTMPDTSIVINELLSANTAAGPDHDADGNFSTTDEQFVELYNNSDGVVDIGGWDLSDTSPPDAVFPGGVVMGPRQFIVIYRGTDSGGFNFFRYNSSGTIILETGTMGGAAVPSWAAADRVILRNAADGSVDTMENPTETNNKSRQRVFDGAETIIQAVPTPGVNRDPKPFYGRPSPNARIILSTSPSSITDGDSLNLTLTIVDADTNTITTFTKAVSLSTDSGTILPETTGVFSSGARVDSITILGITTSGTATITASWLTTTSGTAAITVLRRSTVTCTVNLEGRANEAGCTGVLYNGADTYTAVSDTWGAIAFASVKAGTYNFTGKENHHLRRTVASAISVAGADTGVSIGTLTAGDINDDNQINIFDAAITRFFMFFGYAGLADIDGDADVDAADLSWVRANFGKRGD